MPTDDRHADRADCHVVGADMTNTTREAIEVRSADAEAIADVLAAAGAPMVSA
ncbi:hypothetical protein O3Q52_44625 [Streptomyces sp. ActVer]|jgi:hypothetical protein|uniref:hypothetical protein n=1 Tax=Streptomyces sp. ActVer TaxID=3014558 RepID=UPI0022B407A0|nr:hypothetical protein [Streptomyces sp. ActVer]MCZ4515086.1 hypothetical protein [Streptomyces sp. ActVer]